KLTAGPNGPASLPISILPSALTEVASGLNYAISMYDPAVYGQGDPRLPPMSLALQVFSNTTILAGDLSLAFPNRASGDWRAPLPIPGAVSLLGVGSFGNSNGQDVPSQAPSSNKLSATLFQGATVGLANAA